MYELLTLMDASTSECGDSRGRSRARVSPGCCSRPIFLKCFPLEVDGMKDILQRTHVPSSGLPGRLLSPREISRRLSLNRRDFLRSATGAALGSVLTSSSPFVHGEKAKRSRKVIVITFG